ncbi:hypothetical protein Tco_0916624 [Tanacetum coccineum]
MQSLQGHVTALQGQVIALQGQVTALQGQQGPAGGRAQPELPEEAGSSSYVVPTSKDNFIVSAGRPNMVPAGRTIVSPEDEGVVLERPSETQPTPSPTHPKGSGGNPGGQSSSDRSQSGTEDDLTVQSVYDLCIFLCKQVTAQAVNIKDLKAQIKQLKKKARPVINHHKAWIKNPAFDDLDDAIDYMETEDALDKGTVKDSEETRVSTEDQVSTDKPKVSINKLKVSTDKPNEGTAEPNEGTIDPKDGNSDESAAPTTVFRDDETIA